MARGNRGFASMDEDTQRAIASKSGKMSGGDFANDPLRTSVAGRKGAVNQSIEAKRRGGQHSHRNTWISYI